MQVTLNQSRVSLVVDLFSFLGADETLLRSVFTIFLLFRVS
jgi:hypothetical protein